MPPWIDNLMQHCNIKFGNLGIGSMLGQEMCQDPLLDEMGLRVQLVESQMVYHIDVIEQII